jgi:hypothetical protein
MTAACRAPLCKPLLSWAHAVVGCALAVCPLPIGSRASAGVRSIRAITVPPQLQDFICRRLKDDVLGELKPLEEVVVNVELTVLQKTYYRAIYEKNIGFLQCWLTQRRCNTFNLYASAPVVGRAFSRPRDNCLPAATFHPHHRHRTQPVCCRQ